MEDADEANKAIEAMNGSDMGMEEASFTFKWKTRLKVTSGRSSSTSVELVNFYKNPLLADFLQEILLTKANFNTLLKMKVLYNS